MEKLFPGEIQLFVYDSVDAAWQHPETSVPGNKNISRNKDVLKLQNHRRPYWSLPWKQSENHQLLEFRWRLVGIWKFFTVGIDNGKGQCTFKLVTVSWWEENIWHGTCNSKELPLRFTCSYLPRNSRGQSTLSFVYLQSRSNQLPRSLNRVAWYFENIPAGRDERCIDSWVRPLLQNIFFLHVLTVIRSYK